MARRNSLLIIIDYNPLYTYQTDKSYIVEKLFRIENAIYYLVKGEPALIWYPSEYIVNLLKLLGWVPELVKLIYSRTPWEKELLQEHIDEIKKMCVKVNHKGLRENFFAKCT